VPTNRRSARSRETRAEPNTARCVTPGDVAGAERALPSTPAPSPSAAAVARKRRAGLRGGSDAVRPVCLQALCKQLGRSRSARRRRTLCRLWGAPAAPTADRRLPKSRNTGRLVRSGASHEGFCSRRNPAVSNVATRAHGARGDLNGSRQRGLARRRMQGGGRTVQDGPAAYAEPLDDAHCEGALVRPKVSSPTIGTSP
jgi:hypothetical protein